jgi:hypothetical protein
VHGRNRRKGHRKSLRWKKQGTGTQEIPEEEEQGTGTQEIPEAGETGTTTVGDTQRPTSPEPSATQEKRPGEHTSGGRKKAKAHKPQSHISLTPDDVELVVTTVEERLAEYGRMQRSTGLQLSRPSARGQNCAGVVKDWGNTCTKRNTHTG